MEEEKLLRSDRSDSGEEDFGIRHSDRSRSRLNRICWGIAVFVSLCSFTWNVVATSKLYTRSSDIGRSPFSGLGYDTPTVYRARTDYWSDNSTLSDELWESIDTSPVGIALADDWAAEHNIPLASRFPWDNAKGTYFIKAFHQLHCLKLMRRKVIDLQDGVKSDITWEHYQHCLDALRQDLMCRADDTPMYARIGGHLGDGQVVMCRNWDKLIAWTQAPEQNACYRTLDDYKEVKHSLERYAFCPEDSPYRKISEAYFDKWGHQEAFY